ncbi:MAG: ABC-F family ATP-binding cassette domain-containing protein [Candidatus Competibacteraceae bacterium]|nr:ABC-F family ATP-binding cassette domain-containing protein [Candidatus Competibacteraceae bacterium]
MTAPDPLIHCRAAWFGFERPLLGPLDVVIPKGVRWAITGPNGCGKSLFLRGLIDSAVIHSGLVARPRPIRANLLAQEHPRPRPWPLSGWDWFSAMGARPPELSSVRDLLSRRLDRLSGGQWQLLRLAAAVATPHDDGSGDRLVLLDEPGNHLDSNVRTDAMKLIADTAPGNTLLLASHDVAFADAIGAEIVPLATLLPNV